MNIREELEAIEAQHLSPKACRSRDSKGRVRSESPHDFRTAFQRDRDRILHSKSFRRLKHKTQVFLAPFGDHYRTRLTHTLEVSAIARTISRALRLNEDLTEAIALGHDLGHTPFGHAGEATLARLLPGGFTHYDQSLRVVDKLEYDGKGLNLSFEVRDGIARHSKGRGKILDRKKEDLPSTLEGQVVRVSDVIAYVNRDLDDAMRAGLLRESDIPRPLVAVLGKYHAKRIDKMVVDVVESSLKAGLGRIAMSDEIMKAVVDLRDFLYDRVYHHPEAKEELRKTEKIIRDLFGYFAEHPDGFVKDYPAGDPVEVRVADIIAGMTDRYAMSLYERLFFPKSWRT
ncbi:MAG: deoxyguanosinetriphosphate triphosphohydrolase [Candidatus Aminicenantes bacterium]|nr:deoxyguanosinetriphosphate triphosphohydrolase [Candidatus Aminicenantes bacterium]